MKFYALLSGYITQYTTVLCLVNTEKDLSRIPGVLRISEFFLVMNQYHSQKQKLYI